MKKIIGYTFIALSVIYLIFIVISFFPAFLDAKKYDFEKTGISVNQMYLAVIIHGMLCIALFFGGNFIRKKGKQKK